MPPDERPDPTRPDRGTTGCRSASRGGLSHGPWPLVRRDGWNLLDTRQGMVGETGQMAQAARPPLPASLVPQTR